MNLLDLYSRDLCHVCGQTPCNCTHITEGEVVPFKRPQLQALTWQQLPKDVLVLASDWYWADQDNSGVDALLDPDGFGNGTANELKYITAKLRQRGWNIDYNDEHDAPGEFNLKLTNNRGQTVLLSIEDAQDFTGWAQGTDSMSEEKVRLDPKCWKGKKIGNPKTKIKGGVRVNNCVPAESVEEGVTSPEIKQAYADIFKTAPRTPERKSAVSKYMKLRSDALDKQRKEQGVAEGAEFGAYYYEQLAQQVFDTNPNLTDENEILNLGYKIAKGELGSRTQGMFRDEDFPSDFVSAYGYLKKQSVAEEEQEANYGKKYQDMVKRMGAKAREQEQSRPVDIGALARKLRDIEQSQAQDKK